MPLADLALAGAAVPGVVCAVYWGAAFFKMRINLRSLPTARAGLELALPDPAPRVGVIVPAHNEERSLPILLESLLAQRYAALDVTLALDRCSDASASIANGFVPRFAGAGRLLRIVTIDACPPGWAGKTHALHAGVTLARREDRPDLLLFLDADTRLDPGCIRACVALLRHRNLGMLSLLSTLSATAWFERVAQPAAALELLRQYPLRSANRWPNPRPFANGQCMLFTGAAYDAAGGHESVRAELLEDIALARRLFYANVRTGVLLADGMLACRMYASWDAFRRGWKRIFTESANRRSPRLASLALRTRWMGAIFPALAWSALVGGAIGIALGAGALAWVALAASFAGALAHLGASHVSVRAQRAPSWVALAQPLGAWLTADILAEAAADLREGRATAWGGLSYAIHDRGRQTPSAPDADPALARW